MDLSERFWYSPDLICFCFCVILLILAIFFRNNFLFLFQRGFLAFCSFLMLSSELPSERCSSLEPLGWCFLTLSPCSRAPLFLLQQGGACVDVACTVRRHVHCVSLALALCMQGRLNPLQRCLPVGSVVHTPQSQGCHVALTVGSPPFLPGLPS